MNCLLSDVQNSPQLFFKGAGPNKILKNKTFYASVEEFRNAETSKQTNLSRNVVKIPAGRILTI